jgi:hypothetical protein
MSFLKLNKTRVATKQDAIDLAVQEYGSIEGLFKVIDQNIGAGLTIDSLGLSAFVGELFTCDNRTEQEIETVKKFFLDDKIVVNNDIELVLGPYSSGYSLGYQL